MKEKKLHIHSPYSGKKISCFNKEDIFRVIECAINAKKKANSLTPYERYKILYDSAEEIKSCKEELAAIITDECKKTIKDSEIEVKRSHEILKLCAEESTRIYGESIPVGILEGLPNKTAMTLRKPIGVILVISPFNYPLGIVLHKVGPALAAGNSVILKPSSKTPIIASRLGEILNNNGLPEGMFSVVVGHNKEIGDELVRSKGIDMISFTGSVETGKRIASNAGMKKLSLELGGNGPLLVFDDADLKRAVKTSVKGAFDNAGQKCTSIKRLFLHKKIADDFIKAFVEETKKLKVGDPSRYETDIGPLITEDAAIEVERKVNDAIQKGGKLLLGGKRKKSFYWPTIIDNTPLDSDLIITETFGPIAPMIRFSDLKEVIEIVNSTQYGLQAGVFTNNLEHIKYCIDHIETGAIMVNEDAGFRAEHLPFGGVKNSGFGREGIRYAINEMTEIKTIVL